MNADIALEQLVSRTKEDLVFEVWERLDCESIGAPEIEVIERIVAERFGDAAVDSPMIIARMLADEGAELRHSEIMELYVARNAETVYSGQLRNILNIKDLDSAASSLRRMEALRQKYIADSDSYGLRLLMNKARHFKDLAHARSIDSVYDEHGRFTYAEIAEWLTIWLRTPEMFDSWLNLRVRSKEFRSWFGRETSDA